MTEPGGRWARWRLPVVLALVLAGILLRVVAASRPGLWADEIFSLSMATGHSLEHPAADAVASLGDYVETPDPASPAAYRRYAEHDPEPAGPRRVVRAVLLSDTSPPLYYLLLNPWTRLFGTGDPSLRLFSVWWATLSLPLLWLLARDLGGERAASSALLLFGFSPVAIFYSVEGRMYALLWFIALALAWLSLRLAREGARPWPAALWVLTGAAGLLSHYFFGFVWLACGAWLGLESGRLARPRLALLAGLTLVLVLPWYLQVPGSLARWRVTGTWLVGELSWPGALGKPFALAGSLLASSSNLGGAWRWADHVVAGLLLLTAVLLARQGAVRALFSGAPRLLWAWVAAVCFGPLVFDLLRDTTTVELPRYALPGLPAALLLVALAVSRLPPAIYLAVLAGTLVAWLPGARRTVVPRVSRPWEPYPSLNARLQSAALPGDLVLVHSTPSGVVGVARYLDADPPFASWVPWLDTRQVPGDLERLLRGRRRVALVKIHYLGAPSPPEEWLRANGRTLGQETFRRSSAQVLYFGPREGEAFFPAAAPGQPGPGPAR